MSRPGKGADHRAWQSALELLDAPGDDAGSPLPSLIPALLEVSAMSKAARKGVAAAVDGHAERREFVRARLAELADEEPDGRTERLLRRATGADAAAQVRKNPIARNEGFACAWCGKDVPPAPGGGIRNHCPWCLRSLHVDGPVPGDRASGCGGVMHPISFEGSGDLRVLQRCARCGHERRNGLHPHWSEAPDLVDPKLLGTSGGGPAGGRG